MRSSSGAISIAANARKLDVDNRISLRYYYRIADNLLKQVFLYLYSILPRLYLDLCLLKFRIENGVEWEDFPRFFHLFIELCRRLRFLSWLGMWVVVNLGRVGRFYALRIANGFECFITNAVGVRQFLGLFNATDMNLGQQN